MSSVGAATRQEALRTDMRKLWEDHGPEPWEAESVGSLDIAAGLAELGIVALGVRMTFASSDLKGIDHA